MILRAFVLLQFIWFAPSDNSAGARILSWLFRCPVLPHGGVFEMALGLRRALVGKFWAELILLSTWNAKLNFTLKNVFRVPRNPLTAVL